VYVVLGEEVEGGDEGEEEEKKHMRHELGRVLDGLEWGVRGGGRRPMAVVET